jgi:ABC-type transporter Mla subunit MlaD
MPRMLNPLALPQAVIDGFAALPGMARDARRATELLEASLSRADDIVDRADRLLESFDRAEATIALLVERGGELVAMGNATSSELAQARLQLERAVPTVEALQAQAGPLLDTAAHAREQLEKAGEELHRANAQMTRVIDLGGPLEKASERMERIRSRVRRDSPDEPPIGPPD